MPERKRRKTRASGKEKKQPDVKTRLKTGIDTVTRERMKSEKSESYAETVMSIMREPLVVLDADSRVVSANKAFYETFRIVQTDVEGKAIFERGDRTWDLPMLREQLNETLTEGKILDDYLVEHDFPVIGRRVLLVNARPMAEEPGQFNKIVVTFNDITELKKAEEEVARAGDKWERTFDSMPDLVAILDTEHRIVRANKSMAQRLGMTPEQCVGFNCFKCVHMSGAPPSLCPHCQTMADGKEHVAEIHEDNLGGDFLVTTTPMFDHEGNLTGSVYIARDITERKKAEEKVRYLSRFPDENPNVVMRVSKDGDLLYSNKAGLQILQGWNVKVGQQVQSEWRELVADVFKSGVKREVEEENSGRIFLMMVTPIVEEGYVNIYGREITLRKKAEEELRKAHEELEIRVQKRTRELTEATDKLQAEIAERKKAYIEAKVRADQQAVVAQLGQLALQGSDLDELFNETVKRIAQTLNVEYCKILESLPGERELLLLAGIGWKDGLVGHATVGTGTDSQAGYTLLSDKPVVVEELGAEKRFRGTPLLHEHKVVSGMSVIIPSHEKPFGVLGAHTTKRRTFTSDDIIFLQAVANVLATAIEHKQGEETIKAERKRFTDVLDKLPAYLILLTPDYYVSYANHFFRERFGEIRGKRCYEYLFGRKEPCVLCETIKVLKNVTPLEWEWTGPDGRNYYIFDSPFTDTDGSTLIMEVGIDITERKQAEEALRKAHEELETRVEERTKDLTKATEELAAEVIERKHVEQALRESQIDLNRAQAVAKTGSWRLDVRRDELLWSDETHRMFGIPKGTPLTYETFLSSVHPDDKGYVDQRWQAATRGEPYDIEHRIIVNGEIKWVREKAELELDKDGTLKGGFGTVQDITERKQLEEKLIMSERKYRTLYETSTDGFLSTDMQGNILECNDAYAQMLGYSKDELRNMTYQQLTPEKWHKMEAETVQEAIIKKGHSEVYEKEYIRKDGSIFPISIRVWLIRDENWRPAAMWGIVRDETQRKQLENELKRYSEHLERLVEERTKKLKDAERLAAIGETAGMVGHDIRNPLQTVEGAIYLAKEEIKSLQPRTQEINNIEEMLKTIEEETTYVNKIVSDLQDYARPLEPQFEDIDTQQLINGTLATLEIPPSVEASVTVEQDCRTMVVDPTMMKRILTNLIANAVQAMPNGGTLTITVSMEQDEVHINIKDTGQGIPEENKPKVFGPLFSTKAKGQGFGLAAVKRLVEAHSGTIAFDSEVGRGTTFTVAIPVAKEAS